MRSLDEDFRVTRLEHDLLKRCLAAMNDTLSDDAHKALYINVLNAEMTTLLCDARRQLNK